MVSPLRTRTIKIVADRRVGCDGPGRVQAVAAARAYVLIARGPGTPGPALSACSHRRCVCVEQVAVEDRLALPGRGREAEPGVDRRVDRGRMAPTAALDSGSGEGVAEERVCIDRDQVVVVLERRVARFA